MFGEYYYQRFFVDGKENGRIFISAGLDDNPHLDADQYKEALAELDPVEREQLLHGNWQIKANGDLLDRHWFTIVPHHEIPANASRVRFWDLAGTDPSKRKGRNKRDPDWTVGFKLAHYQGIYWIEDIIRIQKKPLEIEETIKAAAAIDGYSCAIRMEQEPGSSGIITIDHYARNVLAGYDFAGVTSTGSKVERSRAASAAAQAGRVMVSDRCRNMLPFFDEADLFPYGAHDDTIDGFSGAFNHFRSPTLMRVPTGLKKSGGSYWTKFHR
jgi:predicted phage terminase large subunit-like protein